jgi:signal transduction histidine kinase
MPPGPNGFAASGAMSAGIRRTGPLDPVWHKVMSVPLVREWRVISDAIFVLTSFVFGLFWVITFAVAGAIGTGLLVIGVGIPILAALFALAIFGAQQERSRLRIFLGEDIPSPYRYLPTEGPIWRRAWGMVRNPQLWRDIGYLLLLFPMGVLGLWAISVPFNFLQALPVAMAGGSTSVYWWQVNHFVEAVVAFAFGLVLVVPFSALINLTALLHVRAGRRLLAPSNEEMLIERVEELTESRSAVMRAMHLERRRIERDLHDGAQQRLVSLAMELGLAREKMQEDPEGARKLLEASHEDAKLVLAELRDLVRGIHPAVLTDRGLDAAISAIAGRSPIPVEVDVDLDRRQPDEVEGSAYFVVVEALTNIAKHSAATGARVHITRDRGWLKLEVSDNGKGGARLEAGSGLRGLRDRVTALDGRFSLDSPPGVGTTVRAEIPCL